MGLVAVCLMASYAHGADELDGLITKVAKGKTAKERVQAAEAIGKMGEDASKASDVLCMALMSGTPSIRVAAIEAIEKVRPDLYKQLVIILTANDTVATRNKKAYKAYGKGDKEIIAIKELGLMGEKAKPTVPILFTLLRTELATGRVPQSNKLENFHQETLSGACFDAIETISPDDPETQRIILILAGPATSQLAARASACRVVGKMVQTDKDFRKKALPVIAKAFYTNSPLLTYEATIAAGKFGKDAKELVPMLKKIKLNGEELLREAANAAIDAIEEDEK
jgi:hypothetical protein